MMLPAITTLSEKINSRVLRERILIFLTALTVLFLVFNFLIQSRLDQQKRNLEIDLEKVTVERKTVETQLTAMAMAEVSNPANLKKREIIQLKQKIAEVEQKLSGLSQGLISAEELPRVLEQVLLSTTTVSLLSLQTLAVQELQLASLQSPLADEQKQAGGEVGTGVYKHAVVLKVSGSYSQLVQLLTAIEALEWKFYWESLDYQVKQYPQAEIEIHVFTLSSEEGLLGV